MLLGKLDQLCAAGQIPFAPRGYDLDVGIQRIGAEFEAHLIVALTGRAMRDGVGAFSGGNLNQAFGD